MDRAEELADMAIRIGQSKGRIKRIFDELEVTDLDEIRIALSELLSEYSIISRNMTLNDFRVYEERKRKG